jgi:hypothetical protein
MMGQDRTGQDRTGKRYEDRVRVGVENRGEVRDQGETESVAHPTSDPAGTRGILCCLLQNLQNTIHTDRRRGGLSLSVAAAHTY